VPVVKECGAAIRHAGLPDVNYTNLEACIAAKVLVEAIRRSGREVTRESLYKALQGLNPYDAGGYVVTFTPDARHGSHYVELSVISRNVQFLF
jgi:branched-chain amino acid transport system substrate-binding protein